MRKIITAENINKLYRIRKSQAGNDTLRESLAKFFKSPLSHVRGGGRAAEEDLWALRNVSFEVSPGEVVGIIGANGAGKSTLFKILARVIEPTGGRIQLYGKVSSLLEVGTGFHPELTGRENIFLNGSILGMGRNEIARKFDEIVAFAEIEKFLETPVKRYSSGMYMRLAFSVAAHMEPEILLVDEVLAVGDASFQQKCLGKIGQVATEGRTVLFVSHNMTAVQALCNRVLWLKNGEVVEEASAVKVVSDYLKGTITNVSTEKVWADPAEAPGNDKVRIRRVCVRPASGSPSDLITVRTPLVLEFEYWNLEPDSLLNLCVLLYNQQGTVVFITVPVDEPVWHGRPFPAGLFRSVCHIPGDLLNNGRHRIRVLVVKNQATAIYSHDDALAFDVNDTIDGRGHWYGEWEGAVRPRLEWETELLKKGPASVPAL